MKKIYLALILACLSFLSLNVIAQTTSFTYTGSVQTFTVPAGTTSLIVDLAGAEGGPYTGHGSPGKGGRVQANLAVTAGQVLYIYVGQVGASGGTGTVGAGGTNSGGGANGGSGSSSNGGAAGGGATDIRLVAGSTGTFGNTATPLGSRLIVGGGGAGTAWDCGENGGDGGYPSGGNGNDCGTFWSPSNGGTQTAGGPAYGGGSATAGGFGPGGNAHPTWWGSGGGGGWYGGGGCYAGSGGGGSSYYGGAGVTLISHTSAYQAGNGYCNITVPCQTVGAISGSATVCQGATTTYTNPTGASGGTWTSSNTSIATVNSSTGVVTGVAVGSCTITYVLSNPCGGTNPTKSITVLPIPGTIGGTLSACLGTTSTLTNPVAGGTWLSATTSVATIGSSSGTVTPVSLGTTSISYNLGNGCVSATAVFTVNSFPSAITGTSLLCTGATTTLSDATSGGTWSVNFPTVATVSGGLVTGVTGGIATITYTVPTGAGCFVTQPVTVNAAAPITGGSSLCNGYSITMSSATTGGGTWSSSNTGVATINSSGLLTSVSIGSTTITFTSTLTGCFTTAVVNVTAAPTAFTVIGGGPYCAVSGGGSVIGLNGAGAGVTYTLFSGALAVATFTSPSTAAFNFAGLWPAGSYNVVANYGSPCAATMLGTAVVTSNPLPTAFAVTGGGNYCTGGTGVTVGLASSTIGVNYQLIVSGVPVGSPVAGTGGALNFGLQTTTGSYSVTAVNTTTGCTNTMTGTVSVGTNPLPPVFSITSGASGYCVGGPGVTIGLSGSTIGINYQLFVGGVAVGGLVVGTGTTITFGSQTAVGAYTVVATNPTTGCTNTMSGSASIALNPLPTAFLVTGTGAYCFGGTGVALGLNGTQVGVSYQLYNGTSLVGAPVAGTGAAISFGLQTAVGSYTVVATNTTTLCTNNMTGSAAVTTNPLPSVFSVTGGGAYCAGGTGAIVGLAGSTAGVNYQLFNGATLIGAASGTGSAISFGLQTLAGTYSVVATNASTGCVANMSGSATVTISPLPAVFNVSNTGATSYCAGGTGVTINLSGSAAGVNYNLYNGSSLDATLAGTGAALNFTGRTNAGSYTVVAVNATTGCTSNMTGSGLITINPLPTIYTMTGGGGYCAGGAGIAIGLASSNVGISYQLFNTLGAVGAPVAGTGGAISFGLQTTASLRDSIVATNTVTGCVSIMSGNVAVSINSLPTQFSVTGGGGYCNGGTGRTINLASSVIGTTYQLFNGTSLVGAPLAGTGSALVFGPATAAGTYTIVATNTANSCTANMAGAVTITINPLPTVFSVTGGGAYCSGAAGPHVVLSSSVSGINYQLYNGLFTTGSLVPGTGLALDFGAQTAAGTYTVVAINPLTLCQSNMSGSVNISINPLPTPYTITQSATSYCAGGAGVSVGLSNSAVGNSYQLFNLGSPVGSPMLGTGAPLDFGLQTASGNYTVVATNQVTGCTANMLGIASVAANALPAVQTIFGGGNYCPGGTGRNIGMMSTNAGINYQLYNGSLAVGLPVPGVTGFPINFGLQTGTGTYTVVAINTTTGCTRNMAGSVTIGIDVLPTLYNVTGGGNYCVGGTGVHVGLSGSAAGVLYQLFDASAPMGAPAVGSGSAIDFGLQTTSGNYTVVATSTSTTCSANMFGSATVGTNPLPAAFNVTGGGNYCAGATGSVIGLDGSATGTTYHMFMGGLPIGSTVTGTGGPLSFGAQTTVGAYTVVATTSATGCNNTMTGTVNIDINPLPATFAVTGGGSYCIGGAGLTVSLAGSDPAASYQLYLGSSVVGTPLAGTGGALNFGVQTASGTYSVKAIDNTTGCSTMMTGTVTININTLPTPFIVSGGGNYCAGDAGVHVSLSGSTIGVVYRVFINGLPSTFTRTGTGSGIDFGAMTAAGVYTIVATNPTSSCTNNMIGTVNVGINPLPALHNAVSTSSSYCAGGAGVEISLDGSDVGISYQAYLGILPIGISVDGTGSVISLGYVTGTGVYHVTAKNNVTGCMVTMTPSISVNINPLPTVFVVTGGGTYCNGGSGVHIGTSGSNAGISYQLYRAGLPVGAAVAGTGTALDFGFVTGAGSYSVMATNNATTCTNNMTGSATVAINAVPTAYNITGGGNYCATGAGLAIGLDASSIGISYQLKRGGVNTGTAVAGTGAAISFGLQTAAGLYSVVATNSVTGCTAAMTGTSTIVVNPMPTVYNVTGGGNYCPGGTGVAVGLNNSASGFTYQLFNGAAPVGTSVYGVTGASINFGLQTATGIYNVVALDNATGCSNAMSGSATVGLHTLPVAQNVVGGGSYCEGGTGVHVGLAGSASGISYSLYSSLIPMGTITGTGGPVDFGFETASGNYTVVGTNTTTGCNNNMTGSVNVTITPAVAPLVTINSGVGDTTCSGNMLTFSPVTINGGTSPSYVWTVNGVVAGVGANYAYIPVNGDIVGVTATSNQACAMPTTASNSLTMTVLPKAFPTVTTTADPGNEVCQGATVTFNAIDNYGGAGASFAWIKNGLTAGTSSTFSYVPANGDNVYCLLTSDYRCRLANTGTSTHYNMIVDLPTLPIVSISALPGANVAFGQNVTLVASIVNGGPRPSIQWLVNGVAIPGATGTSFSSNSFNNLDSITCQVLSSGGCAGLLGTNSVTIHVASVGVAPVAVAGSNIVLVPNPNKGNFTIKGSFGAATDEKVAIEVVNMLGQVVFTQNVISNNGELNEQIKLNSSLANGMYILNLRTVSENKTFHFVIEQ